MNSVFIHYKGELPEGSKTEDTVVLEVPAAIMTMEDIAILQDFIEKTFGLKMCRIINFRRMEEAFACPKCGSHDITHSHSHCIKGLPQPIIESYALDPSKGDNGGFSGGL